MYNCATSHMYDGDQCDWDPKNSSEIYIILSLYPSIYICTFRIVLNMLYYYVCVDTKYYKLNFLYIIKKF